MVWLLPWGNLNTKVTMVTIECLVKWKVVFWHLQELCDNAWSSHIQNINIPGYGNNVSPSIRSPCSISLEKFFWCCYKCPGIDVPSLHFNRDKTSTCPTMCFHFYRLVSCCTVNVQRSYEEENIYVLFPSYMNRNKRKTIHMDWNFFLEKYIAENHKRLYITVIQMQ